ncbi:MAG: tRNA (adenosine(37)-N6)-threonylcarbamoyltransferase complex ATPase subunit type 1 TsaE [Bacteroidetes bacterium]|nr:tRNA (adenosine(37)-N6)-threonylcarbamoyltransferase complex ATPase subunit type 1 TsaE [Bacteroidota bacterium]MCH8231180.1 tRNA (adenosine(37)-N6)-threonylcarbamoyltransferase complex ATPase subunit type 1 TsaE [Bacteroidota bacterium]
MVDAVEKQLILTCKSLLQLPEIASQIVIFKGNCNVIAFYGELGAGKTTLIKSICNKIDVEDIVSSPTFAIINEYLTNSNDPVYHFDFFRIKDAEEALNIGVDEYLFSGHLCLIEWPEVVNNLLPEKLLKVRIEVTGPESRIFHLEKHG